jgi:hypothetical protein
MSQYGTMMELAQDVRFREGQTSDFGIRSQSEMARFLEWEFPKAYFFVLEELTLSIALWKLACGLQWEEVIVPHSNKGTHARKKKLAKIEKRRPLVQQHHSLDYVLYEAAKTKMYKAGSTYPDQDVLKRTIDRIRDTNTRLNNLCIGVLGQGSLGNKASAFFDMCKLANLKPMPFAEFVDRSSSKVNLDSNWDWNDSTKTLRDVFEELKDMARIQK